jgi:hypothetical protein
VVGWGWDAGGNTSISQFKNQKLDLILIHVKK